MHVAREEQSNESFAPSSPTPSPSPPFFPHLEVILQRFGIHPEGDKGCAFEQRHRREQRDEWLNLHVVELVVGGVDQLQAVRHGEERVEDEG